MNTHLRFMNENTTILKNSGILYVRLILTSITGLISSRILLQELGVSDFGLYNVVGGIVVLMSFLNTVMTSTSFRFIAFELGKGDSEGVNKVFNISLVIHIFLAIIVVVFAETIGMYYIKHYLNVPAGSINDSIFVFRLSVLATIFTIISMPFQGLITAKEKFSIRASIEVLSGLFKLGSVVGLIYYAGNVLRLYAVLIAVVLIIISLLYILYCWIKYKDIIFWNLQKDKTKYQEMLSFSAWILLGAGASVGKVQGAALIINAFFGTILNASFSIASQVNSVVLMFSQNLGQAAIPQITKSYSIGNTERNKQLVTFISKYSFFLMLLPALPLLLETEFILNLWLTEVPIYTTIFCKLMIINALIDTMSAGLPALINASGKIKYFQIILSSIMLLSLPIAYILFRFGFPPHYFLLTFIGLSIINTIIRQILLKIILKFDIKYFIKKSYFQILKVAIIIIPLFMVLPLFQSSLTRFVLFSFISIFWTLLSIYFLGLEKSEKLVISSIINNTLSKKRNG